MNYSNLVQKYFDYKKSVEENLIQINKLRSSITVIDSESFTNGNIGIEMNFGLGNSSLSGIYMNKDCLLNVVKCAIDGLEQTNKPMVEFCEKFEKIVAEAYAKEQAVEPPPVSELSVYGHSRLG